MSSSSVEKENQSPQITNPAYKSKNQELEEARNRVRMEKKQTRQQYKNVDRERNLRLKRMIHTTNNSTAKQNDPNYPIPQLYAIRVSTCPELRSDLRLNGREKRGRMFIELNSNGSQTLSGLKFEMHSFFRCLRKSTYVISAKLPELDSDGNVVMALSNSDASKQHEQEDNNTTATAENESANECSDYFPIDSDQAVNETFSKAIQFYNEHHTSFPDILKRPSLFLHVSKDPNAPPPPPPPSYLNDMADPKLSKEMTMLSFYAFPPPANGAKGTCNGGIEDPEEFAIKLKKLWKPFEALGRIYVAEEGVNAQMAVPSNVLSNFVECCNSIPELGEHMENGINIDPIPLTMEEFNTAGAKQTPAFKALHIRVRHQVVSDGLDKPLNWQSAGYDMPPLEWHNKLEELKNGSSQSEKPLVFDCRNTYETSVGIFEGAEPLDTENFRDSWSVLKERLKDTPKDAPIMTYCTGGIRCVKVGAYLTQELGYTNVSRLAGGIIGYDRTMTQNATISNPNTSLFKGTNYVFDGRVNRQITDDELGECITCGAKTNRMTNCANGNCHIRMVQCENCRTTFHGTCSEACKQRVLNGNTIMSETITNTNDDKVAQGGDDEDNEEEEQKYETIDEYSMGHSSPIPPFFNEIQENTISFLPSGSHMTSGPTQGKLLTTLTSMTREGRVLEIGSFTGYATACFLQGSANAGEALDVGNGGRDGGPFVLSLERDSRALGIASGHLRVMEEFGVGMDAAMEAKKMRGNNGGIMPINEMIGDRQTFNYKNISTCELLRVSDALATIEEMAYYNSNTTTAPFDIVFVDADKTRLLDYVEACVKNDRILKKGGLIIVDNTLWKGIVLEASHNGFTATAATTAVEEDQSMDAKDAKRSRRARKLAGIMHDFNQAIVKDTRVEVLLLPLRDGLSAIRKR